jgi:cytochrome c
MKYTITTIMLTGASLLYAADPGMKLYGKHCVECHGDDGKDTSIAPKPIGGQNDVLSKLMGYKNGTYGGEQKATMEANVAPLSDDDLKTVAGYIAKLQ